MDSLKIKHELAQLCGDSGCNLVLGSIYKIADDEVKFDVAVSSDWYMAKVHVQISIDRLGDFIQQLNEIVTLNKKSVSFINESGNFNLELNTASTGSVEIKGIMSKNMIDDLQLYFGFTSSLNDVNNFYRNLSVAILTK